MILSRVADGLYWMGRYLERAREHHAAPAGHRGPLHRGAGPRRGRSPAAMERPARDLPRLRGGRAAGLGTSPRLAAAYLLGLSIDPDNRYSVFHSLKKARENARSVREALTLEVLPRPQRDVPGARGLRPARPRRPATFRDAMQPHPQRALDTVGAIEHTLTRDDGLALPQARRVARARLPHRADPPHQAARRWCRRAASRRAALLHAVAQPAARRCPRWRTTGKVFGARLEPIDVLQLPLFDAQTPRSLRYGRHRGEGLPRPHLERRATLQASRRASSGKLHAELSYQGHDLIRDGARSCRSSTASLDELATRTTRSPRSTSRPEHCSSRSSTASRSTYDAFIRESFLELRVQPKTTARTRRSRPSCWRSGRRPACTATATGTTTSLHHFTIIALPRPDRGGRPAPLVEHPSRRAAASTPLNDRPAAADPPYPLLDFLAFDGPVQADAALRAAHQGIGPARRAPLGEQVLALGQHIHERFEYRKNVTALRLHHRRLPRARRRASARTSPT